MPPSQRDIEVHKETERRIAAMRIAHRLARCEDPYNFAVGLCVLCLEPEHDPDCPWRMARELVGEAHA